MVIRALSVAAILATLASRLLADNPGNLASPCAAALAQGIVCEAANQRGFEIMNAGKLEAVTVMQNVSTGALVAFVASDPAKLDVTTPVLPLSTVKLLVAASWWNHAEAEDLDSLESQQLLTDMIVSGNDDAGRQIASALRKAIGGDAMLKELQRYGFPSVEASSAPTKQGRFWTELAPRWNDRLTPGAASHWLTNKSSTKEWEDTLSIGETNFLVTPLHLSHFLQAVGNQGVMLPMAARAETGEVTGQEGTPPPVAGSTRIMQESAAIKLQTAMRETVERGSAKSAAPILAGSGWTMGGKTGTGPAPDSDTPGPGSDGCFAGLIFDPEGKARFTVVTFVNHGGPGGSNAARISAQLARFVIGAESHR